MTYDLAVARTNIWALNRPKLVTEVIHSCWVCTSMYNRFSGKIKQQKLPNFVCSLEGGGISTLYIDCHGPLSGGEGRKRWILVCVAMAGYHAFEILKDMTGKTLASVLFNGVFR